ncbi:amino acid ABC transporter permease [Mesorhizobium sp. ES1-4]|uniref:amino acid ABC transporter permease n=1 Tax=Mesorhizobium sp. ES1-4 TaxID=2876627 RepID=UPI001CCEAE63|nr:amino acid ABC transporter permease [Mesorhizobium sp. ES1-4]MBZ9798444.1 amino acid ABC transporter permease [Mesorhizobium sp. ES1-4]
MPSEFQAPANVTLRPPVASLGPLGWLRANLFNSWPNTILTLLAVWLIVRVVPPVFNWAILDAVTGQQSAAACRAPGAGACWSFLSEKWRFILFGLYPPDQHWRPALVVLLIVTMLIVSCDRRLWGWALAAIWLTGLAVVFLLMAGGIFGLPYVDDTRWGGLPLTLIISVVGMVLGFPIAVALALGRRSELPVVRALCIGFIELVRGVPLISVLFMASVMIPLFLPRDVTIDKLLRAEVGYALFFSAYLAEAIRGGLQAIPRGQYEAADSLGLTYWQKTSKIILPQALKLVIAPMVNNFIGQFKDTSLVIIIGIFDLMMTAKTALSDPAWLGFYKEAYLFIAVIYFGFCFFMSRYSLWLERHLHRGQRR